MSPDELRAPGTANPVHSAEDPDLRAIFRARRFAVVPWSRALRLPGAGAHGPREVVFELWERPGDEILARQHGAGAAGAEIERLRRWAGARGARLVLGVPIDPLAAERGRQLSFPTRKVERPPAFSFVFPHPFGERRRLRISPWGFAERPYARLREPWRGVVGEVEALDHRRAIAHFAHADREHAAAARRALRGWARADGWELEISAAPRPLSEPDPAPPSWGGTAVCPDCGNSGATGTFAHIAYGGRGWVPTRCSLCGGRERWWGEPEHVRPVRSAADAATP